MSKVCVILSGSGVYDGSEIHEAVLTLLALSRAGAQVQCAAPDKPQMHVVNHFTGQVEPDQSRNVLHEAARIARGAIIPLSDVHEADYDAIFLPGGFGAAKNLSNFAVAGADAEADPFLTKILRDFRRAGKPIGAVCISPAVLVLALGEGHVTIGKDPGTAEAIEALGGEHCPRAVTELCVDQARKLVTAPAYMLDASLADVATGIEAAVNKVLELCASQP